MHHFTGVFSCAPDVIANREPQTGGACIATTGQHFYIENQSEKTFQVEGVTLTLIGRPYWFDGQGKHALDSEAAVDSFLTDWKAKGVESFKGLSGHFAITIVDEVEQSCHLYSDRIGVHRLYWHSMGADRGIAFGSSLGGIKQICSLDNKICPDALYAYLYFHMVPTPLTIHPDVHKVRPGHVLSYVEGKVTETLLEPVKFDESRVTDFNGLKRELVSVLDESVLSQQHGETKVASFLSGGIDSSTVTGVMAKLSSEPVSSYCMGFDAEEYDETPFARVSANHFQSALTEYYVTPQDVIDVLPKIAASYDEPFGNSSVVPTYYCAKRAADDGVKLMMAGDGGDELFAGNERYAKQRHFDYYLNLPKGLRSNLLDPLIGKLPGFVPLASKAKSYLKQANTPLPDRLQAYNFLNRFPLEDIFSADFLEKVDIEAPLKLQQDVYREPEDASDLNRMLYNDWSFTLADNDLRKVGTMCSLAGVEVSYPLLTDELIQFSMQVPSSLKLKDGKLRYFFKKALEDFLHPETLNKSKHGFGLPFGVWLRDYEPLRKLARDSLEQLKTRGYFKPSFIEHALTMHQQGHASYYGELVWLLMMLELWLQANYNA